ncbi:MAG: hypothetical protein UT05_C0004G0041 [Parcubacteria group bacterium GW2011_GWF2_38_76]|nr:MAG: hypothetical protein UT05_C0004G0041 [Parcubacteria group bacterium GW2011_GWF2_38_76]HBM45655.1 hypothetical protein [Patescibacteria group bacterium]
MFKVNESIIDRLLRLTFGEIFFVSAALNGEIILTYTFYFLSFAMVLTAITGHSFVYQFGKINTKAKTLPIFHKLPLLLYICLPLIIPLVFWYVLTQK